MGFLCGHDTLEDAKRARTAGQLRVRPYELFLFACQQDFQTRKLTKPRKKLGKGFIPEPEYSSCLSIMVAHGGADAALVRWTRDDERRHNKMTVSKPSSKKAKAKKRPAKKTTKKAAKKSLSPKRTNTKTSKKPRGGKPSDRAR